MTCDDTVWTESDVKSQKKIESPSRLQASSLFKLRVFVLQEVLFALVVHSVGVSKYAARAKESPL